MAETQVQYLRSLPERRCRFCFPAGLVVTYAKVGTTRRNLSLGFTSDNTGRADSDFSIAPTALPRRSGMTKG